MAFTVMRELEIDLSAWGSTDETQTAPPDIPDINIELRLIFPDDVDYVFFENTTGCEIVMPGAPIQELTSTAMGRSIYSLIPSEFLEDTHYQAIITYGGQTATINFEMPDTDSRLCEEMIIP